MEAHYGVTVTPRITVNGVQVPYTTGTSTLTMISPECLCPDLLNYNNIGPADNLRGRVVRAFFWLMRMWRP